MLTSRVPTGLLLALALVLVLGVGNLAHAKDDDGVKLSAGATLMHDSNLHRLSRDVNVLALTGKTSTTENIAIATAGISFNKDYSLQRLELGLDLANYRYQNFSNLNFTARNYKAAWLWSLTPRLRGVLSTKQTQTLNSFADFQNFNQSNQRTNVDNRFDAEFEVGARWRMLGGVSRTSQTNQQTLLAEGDFNANSANLGMRYALASGSSLTYRMTHSNGSYLNRPLPSAGLFDNGFQQVDNDIRLNWVIGDKASATANIGHSNRTHSNYAQRDYSGPTAGVALNWRPTGKTVLFVSWARALASFQTTTANYNQTDRFVVSPTWLISTKTLLRGRYELAQRDYVGTPFGVVALPRSDTTHDASVSIDWQPYRFVTLNAGLQNSRRNSNLPGLDYTSNIATFSAQYSY